MPSFCSAVARAASPPADPSFSRAASTWLDRPSCAASWCDEFMQVEHDLAVARRDELPPTVEDREQLFVRVAVRLAPEFLDLRGREQFRHRLAREPPQPGGKRAGDALDRSRQLLFEPFLNVGRRVELVDQVDAERVLDGGVPEEFAAGFGPVIGAQRLPVRPHGETGEEGDDRRDNEQRSNQPPVRVHRWYMRLGCHAPNHRCCGGCSRHPTRVMFGGRSGVRSPVPRMGCDAPCRRSR